MSIFRPVTAPQAIKAGLALFLTGASGPDVPGNPPQAAQAQALAAYRGPTSLAAQPARSSIVATLPAAAVQVAGSAVPVPLPQAWPYAASMPPAPTASQWSIPDADLIFDRLQPVVVAQRQWPYGAAQATVHAPISQAAQTPPAAVSQ